MLDKKKITNIKKYIKELKGMVSVPLLEVNNKETIIYLLLERNIITLKVKNTIDNTETIFKHSSLDYNINVLNVSINKNSTIKYYKFLD
jgi:hypothetical protein